MTPSTPRPAAPPEAWEVTWEDSVEFAGWQSAQELVKNLEPVRCHSIGYVLTDDDKGVMLAGSVNGEDATCVIWIPARQIVKRRKLR